MHRYLQRPERVFNPPELGRLPVVVSSPVWMLGLKTAVLWESCEHPILSLLQASSFSVFQVKIQVKGQKDANFLNYKELRSLFLREWII